MMYLEVSKLYKSFGSHKILKSNNFNLNQGELVSLVGTSGSGKTTLLRCIAGLDLIDSGRIILNSKEITMLTPHKRKISFVFQESPLFPHLNILENIIINLESYDNYLLEMLLKDLKISKILKKYPHQISGGENQRVAVAQSLIRRPNLMLLDEPFNHLDLQIKEKLKEIILTTIRKMNVTTIIVSHNIYDALEMSDKILVIQEGKLVDYNSPQDIYSKPSNLYTAKLFGYVNELKIDNKKIFLRPENIFVDDKSKILVEVLSSVFLGDKFMVKAKLNDQLIVFFSSIEIKNNKKIKISFYEDKILNI